MSCPHGKAYADCYACPNPVGQLPRPAILRLSVENARRATSVQQLHDLVKGEAWSARDSSPAASELLDRARCLLEEAVRELLTVRK